MTYYYAAASAAGKAAGEAPPGVVEFGGGSDNIVVAGPFNADPWTNNEHDLHEDDDFVGIMLAHRNANTADSVTYGGVSATPSTHYVENNWNVQFWYVLKDDLPAAGNNKTTSADMPGSNQRGFMIIFSLKGAAQQAPSTNSANFESAASVGPTAVNCAAGGIAFQAVFKDDVDDVMEEGSGETLIHTGNEPLNADEALFSYKESEGPTVSLSCSWTSSEQGIQGVWGIDPA